MGLIQDAFLFNYEQHLRIDRYLIECSDEQAARLYELVRPMKHDLSLCYQLERLTKTELNRIRQATDLRNASRLNKADLVEALAQWLPTQLSQSLSQLDGRGLTILRSLLSQQCVTAYDFEFDFRVLNHLQDYGLAFAGLLEGLGYALVIPQEIAVGLETVLFNARLEQLIEENDAALQMISGLLEYYGISPLRVIIDQLETFAPGPRVRYDLGSVFEVGLETGYFHYCWLKEGMLVHPGVVDSNWLWQEQQSKVDLDYREITRAEALRAGQDRRGLWNEHHSGLADLLLRKGLSQEHALQAVDTCFHQLRNGQRFVEVVQEVLGLVILDSLDEANQCMRYVADINNTSVTWQTKGHTPEEVLKQEPLLPLPDKPFVIPKKKVGRNDPCPCGSGKKYKKCCGANR